MTNKKGNKNKTSNQKNIKFKSKGFGTRHPQAEFTGFSYHQSPAPFEGMTEDEVVKSIKKLGERHAQKFETSLKSLRERILNVDPCSILSLFAYYDLTTTPGVSREWTEEDPILQHHVELLQGIILQYSRDLFGSKPALPEDFVEFRQLIQNVSRGFQMSRLASADSSTSLEQRQEILTIETIRNDTQAVRNWGYPQQIRRLVSGLFSSIDHEIEQKIGVKISCLVEMWFNIINITEDKINHHQNLVKSVISAKNIKSLINKYHQVFSDLTSDQEKILSLVKEKKITFDSLRSIVLNHSDLRLKDIYTLTIETFVDAYPQSVNIEALQKVLDDWALSFGSLSDYNTEYLFLNNPVWQKPLIKLTDGSYFCPIVPIFLNYLTDMIEAIVKPHTELFQKYEEYRGKFLEEEIYQLFYKAFPSANIYRSSEWLDPTTKKTFENDILVLLDSYLLIIEAKSGRVTEYARRGAVQSLKKILKKLVEEPSIQSKRFSEYLNINPGLHKFKSRQGGFNQIDNSNVCKIIRLSVTLESLSILFCRSTDLKKAGLIPFDVEIATTISLADLEIIFDILEGSCEKIHYLVRREEFEQNVNYVGDEVDLLALYIDTGFNIVSSDISKKTLFLVGMSKIFDPFFLRELPEEESPKPKRKLTKWWRSIIQQMETRQLKHWSEIGCILLNCTYNQQLEFENALKQIKPIVNKFWDIPNYNNTYILINEIVPVSEAVAGIAYKRLDKQKRNQTIENARAEVVNTYKVNHVVVIGLDVEHNHYPYSVLFYHNGENQNI